VAVRKRRVAATCRPALGEPRGEPLARRAPSTTRSKSAVGSPRSRSRTPPPPPGLDPELSGRGAIAPRRPPSGAGSRSSSAAGSSLGERGTVRFYVLGALRARAARRCPRHQALDGGGELRRVGHAQTLAGLDLHRAATCVPTDHEADRPPRVIGEQVRSSTSSPLEAARDRHAHPVTSLRAARSIAPARRVSSCSHPVRGRPAHQQGGVLHQQRLVLAQRVDEERHVDTAGQILEHEASHHLARVRTALDLGPLDARHQPAHRASPWKPRGARASCAW